VLTVDWNSQRRDIRLGVVAALSNGGVEPFPTAAQDRVYDSRQDPLMNNEEGRNIPAMTVYTDSTKRDPISQGFPPFNNRLHVIVEISVGGAGSLIETDSEMEAMLDAMEEQALKALFSPEEEGALQFRRMIKRVNGVESMRLANNSVNTRLAMRDLIIEVEYDQRCAPLSKAFPEFSKLHVCTPTLPDLAHKLSVDELCVTQPSAPPFQTTD